VSVWDRMDLIATQAIIVTMLDCCRELVVWCLSARLRLRGLGVGLFQLLFQLDQVDFVACGQIVKLCEWLHVMYYYACVILAIPFKRDSLDRNGSGTDLTSLKLASEA
jgi:hypothetical protein